MGISSIRGFRVMRTRPFKVTFSTPTCTCGHSNLRFLPNNTHDCFDQDTDGCIGLATKVQKPRPDLLLPFRAQCSVDTAGHRMQSTQHAEHTASSMQSSLLSQAQCVMSTQ